MAHDTLYIVDNSSEKASVKNYLSEWCSISKQMDIATGYFEIGGLLILGEDWQKLDKIRIILGNEVTKRTKDIIEEVAQTMIERFRTSMEREQEKNEFLIGVPAIIKAMKFGKIECRVYDSNKFHAKAYITYFRDEYRDQFISAMNVPSGYALVGSSNFTKAGLTQNIELNVQVKDEVEQLQKWFEEHWQNGTDITEAVLKVMEMHCREFSPYDVYLRSMYEYFKSHEETVSEWEENESVVYKGLSQYQKDGYNSLIQIAERYSGAFLCDGVGLGKTYVGMMLIERFVKKERKNVVLIVPASARVSVWEVTIKRLIPEILEGFYPFKIINHTDLLLDKNQNLMNQIAQQAEIIIIDEAHHFRNRSSNRYRKLFEMMQAGCKKQMFMLTATPINNSFLDLQHLIELFTHRQEDYFSAAPLGIHSLAGHFKKMEKQLNQVSGTAISDSLDISGDIIRADKLVTELVVQRSRAYVKRSLLTEQGNNVLFSERKPPTVANYSLEKSYGRLIKDFKESFDRKDIQGKNIGFITARSNKSDDCSQFYISDCMSEAKCGERTTQSAIFPLYSFTNDFTTNRAIRTPNLNSKILSSVSKSLGLTYNPNSDGYGTDSFAPINLLDYIYAIVYSTKYREKYKEFLKMDFPRVPYPTDQDTFWKLVEIGDKLRECHLMQTKFDTADYSFVGDGTNEVVKPEYKNGRVYISKTQYFDNVPQAQWEQYIGGYQPLQKWLKDRKKTILSAEDIEHYKKIIAALRRTEELMPVLSSCCKEYPYASCHGFCYFGI